MDARCWHAHLSPDGRVAAVDEAWLAVGGDSAALARLLAADDRPAVGQTRHRTLTAAGRTWRVLATPRDTGVSLTGRCADWPLELELAALTRQLAHDLANALHIASNVGEMLGYVTTLTGEDRELLGDLKDASTEASRLTHSLRTLARAVTEVAQPLAASELYDSLAELVTLRRPDLRLTNLPASQPVRVFGDGQTVLRAVELALAAFIADLPGGDALVVSAQAATVSFTRTQPASTAVRAAFAAASPARGVAVARLALACGGAQLELVTAEPGERLTLTLPRALPPE